MELSALAILPGLLIWIAILLLPWRPWSTRESLDSDETLSLDISDITVLIPARNEADNITQTLTALKDQGQGLSVILIDDQSEDETVKLAQSVSLENFSILKGNDLPAGWSGKLWALEQGRKQVETKYILLLDADIILKPGTVSTLYNTAQDKELSMLSLMAHLKMEYFWERCLMPAFIFFFKLLYPFHLANKPGFPIAAAAGGCILLKTEALEKLGGFTCIKDALIDDCSLAKQIKQQGYRTWVGLTHSAISIRNYKTLGSIWNMVSRTAYTQLKYSPWLLVLCTALMLFAFMFPLLSLLQDTAATVIIGVITLFIQVSCYIATLRYYSIPLYYGLGLPLIGILYLLMTWTSAFKYYFGKGAEWKGRNYEK